MQGFDTCMYCVMLSKGTHIYLLKNFTFLCGENIQILLFLIFFRKNIKYTVIICSHPDVQYFHSHLNHFIYPTLLIILITWFHLFASLLKSPT